ncbi:5542_t:CDS:2, partial [Gigaspora rosea]
RAEVRIRQPLKFTKGGEDGVIYLLYPIMLKQIIHSNCAQVVCVNKIFDPVSSSNGP